MYIGYKRLTEGRDHDLKQEYKDAIDKYAKGVEIILTELEKDQENPDKDMVQKLQAYIKRIHFLKEKLKNPFNFPKEPTTIPTILLPVAPE